MPSRSALTAAAARAAHLIVDQPPFVFVDEPAAALLGPQAEELIAYHRLHGDHPVLAGARAQVVLRARVAEDAIAADQYVVLGAGLDSYAYRVAGRAVFEVDHPATQADKRERVAAAGLIPVAELRHVPVDLERSEFLPALVAAGFDPGRPAAVSWLGVSMYLTPAAIRGTLAQLGRLAPGTVVVLDHLLPPALRDEPGRAYAEAVGAQAAADGEPWRSCFAPEELAQELRAAGFGAVRSQSQADLLGPRADALRPAALSVVATARLGQ